MLDLPELERLELALISCFRQRIVEVERRKPPTPSVARPPAYLSHARVSPPAASPTEAYASTQRNAMRRWLPERVLVSDQARDTLMDWDTISAGACESMKATS